MTFEEFFSRCFKNAEDKKDSVQEDLWPVAEQVFLHFDRFGDEEDFYAFFAAHGERPVRTMGNMLEAVKSLKKKERLLLRELEKLAREAEDPSASYGVTLNN